MFSLIASVLIKIESFASGLILYVLVRDKRVQVHVGGDDSIATPLQMLFN